MEDEKIRLQKYIASSGVASRRKAEELILQGKIKVNGKTVTELGTKVDPKKDKIEYNGKTLKSEDKKVYILLNKPIGYVTTVKDQFQRDTVMDLLKGVEEKVVPAGRLDMYTSGALILSNDGDFINKITHPKNEIEKTYNATLAGKITKEDVQKLQEGIEIDLSNKILKSNNDKNSEEIDEMKSYKKSSETDEIKNYKKLTKKEKIIDYKKSEEAKYLTKPAKVKILKIDEEKNLSRIQITIHEGKNREVRKMCEAVGKKVLALHRAKIGNIDVKELKIGKWRFLTKQEIKGLLINNLKKSKNLPKTRKTKNI